ncbi:MAG: GGDEF domain-containing protein [Mobilitalea sp.]
MAATHDELTGIYNRKYFFEEVEKEIGYAKRKKYSFSLLMIDIDHFKNINDTYGHQKGDMVLMEFTKMLFGALRKYDLFGRIGGEEFLIFIQNVSKEEAYIVAEKLRMVIESNDLGGIHYTISIGICSVEPSLSKDINYDDILRQCDLALYEAKNSGRNITVNKVMK